MTYPILVTYRATNDLEWVIFDVRSIVYTDTYLVPYKSINHRGGADVRWVIGNSAGISTN